jgi:hypothetical protein
VFTPFHKPPYTYPYGRSVDKTMIVGAHRGARASGIDPDGFLTVFDGGRITFIYNTGGKFIAARG